MDERNLGGRNPHRLVSADNVEGTAVLDRNGVKIGTIENLMIDKYTGRVAYAVLRFGGFLGVGEDRHPLPWSVLDYNKEEEAFVVDIDKDTLRGAPRYGVGGAPDWDDDSWGRSVYTHYRADSYWR